MIGQIHFLCVCGINNIAIKIRDRCGNILNKTVKTSCRTNTIVDVSCERKNLLVQHDVSLVRSIVDGMPDLWEHSQSVRLYIT